MLSTFLGLITRYEGRKFVTLNDAIDESQIVGMGADSDNQISLYIHIPFCKSLCPYCCFNRYLFREDEARSYFKNLRTELDLYIQRGFKFSTFYIGGGTPTVLMDELLGFISYLKKKLEVKQYSRDRSNKKYIFNT